MSKMHYYLPAYQTSESNINFLIFRKNDSEGNDKSRTSLLKGGVEEKMKKGESKSTNFIRFSLKGKTTTLVLSYSVVPTCEI